MLEHLKHILKNTEFPPPPDVWTNIAESLSESNPLENVRKRLTGFEVSSPEAVWLVVKQFLLQNNENVYHRPFFTRHKRIYKILSAAAVTGLLLMGSMYYMKKSGYKKHLANHITKPEKKMDFITKVDTPEAPVKDVRAAEPLSIDASASLFVPYKMKKISYRESTRLLRNAIIKLTSYPENQEDIVVPAKPIRNEKGDIIQDFKILSYPGDKYIKVTGPNGQQTKISSKFRDLLLYMNGDNDVGEMEGYFDKTFMESLVWKSRFKNWRNIILENSVIPSSTNFMDIVELKDLILKDKEKR